MSYPHPIENIMRSTMEQLKEMLDVNTIVGDPMVAVDGTMIIPISKVSTGFVSGGGEYSKGECIKRKKEDVEFIDDIRHPFAGAAAAGISLNPVAFVVVGDGQVKVIPAQYNCTIDRLVEMIPRAAEEIEKIIDKAKQKKAQAGDPVPPAPPQG